MTHNMSNSICDHLEDILRERLDDYGFRHSCGVSAFACSLATLYGVNVLDATVAGLLHDWDRCESNDALLLKARVYKLPVDDVLAMNPHLLHAHTGALSVRQYFAENPELGELPREVEQAIAHHTVGDTTMSDLDMIVYISDMIEPSRTFPGVDTLREMAGTVALKQLFLQCYQKTMEFLVKNQRLIHPDTLRVWNHYMGEIDHYPGGDVTP